MEKFEKPAKRIPDLIKVMEERGLTISDRAAAEHYLRMIGYYRLSGYMLAFQNGGAEDDRHTFFPGTRFEDVLDRYIFDRKLRLHFMDAIERIEIAVRAFLSGEIAVQRGPIWFTDRSNFKSGFKFDDFVDDLRRHVEHSEDLFIRHYQSKYNDPEWPPSWMVFECATFGAVSRAVAGAHPNLSDYMSKTFGLAHPIFTRFVHCVSHVRNVCAHHGMLWNREFRVVPPKAKGLEAELLRTNTLYAHAVVIEVLLRKAVPDNDWSAKLAALFEEHSPAPLGEMGFPSEWRSRAFWKRII